MLVQTIVMAMVYVITRDIVTVILDTVHLIVISLVLVEVMTLDQHLVPTVN